MEEDQRICVRAERAVPAVARQQLDILLEAAQQPEKVHISTDGQRFVPWLDLREAYEVGNPSVKTPTGEWVAVTDFALLFEEQAGGHSQRHRDSSQLFTSSDSPMNPIQQLIAAGRIEEALKLLAGQPPASRQNEVAVLQGRFHSLQTEIRRGTKTTAEINVERNQIVSAILELAKLLNEHYSDSAPADNTKDRKQPRAEHQPDSVRNILFLAANPANETRIQTDKEHRELKAEFERGDAGRLRYTFLQPQFAVTIGELQRALDARPAIIHFSGHGLEDGIIITNEQNQAQLLGEPALRRIFNRAKDHTELLLLNACFSAVQAQIISGFGIYVVGANRSVQDDACVQFSKAFYSALGRGKSYQDAYDEAITAVSVHHPTEEAKFEAWHQGNKLDW